MYAIHNPYTLSSKRRLQTCRDVNFFFVHLDEFGGDELHGDLQDAGGRILGCEQPERSESAACADVMAPTEVVASIARFGDSLILLT